MATDALSPNDPIIIRYDGIDAKQHQMDLLLLGQSLQGASRLIAVAGNIALTGEYASRVPSMTVRVMAGQPREQCYEFPVYLYPAVPLLPLLSSYARERIKQAVESTVNYVLAKLAGSESEAEKAMETAQKSIEANREVSLKALDVAMAAIQRAGEDQRPAARSFVSPIGATADTALVGDPDRAFVVDRRARAEIDKSEKADIGPSQTFTVRVTELDVVTGTCKLALQGDEADARYDGHVADPVVNAPHSPYSEALDSQDWLSVTAKPHMLNGKLTKLTISDTVEH